MQYEASRDIGERNNPYVITTGPRGNETLELLPGLGRDDRRKNPFNHVEDQL